MDYKLSPEDERSLNEFIQEKYPEYLEDKINVLIDELREVRGRIEKHKDLVAFDGKKELAEFSIDWFRREMWIMQEARAIDELRDAEKELWRYSVKKAYVEKPEHDIDLDLVKTVPIDKLYAFEKKHRAGRGFQALCPFHPEKTPSFMVYEDNNTYYCFGCASGGDNITFITKLEGLTFRSACDLISKYL